MLAPLLEGADRYCMCCLYYTLGTIFMSELCSAVMCAVPSTPRAFWQTFGIMIHDTCANT